MAKLKSSSDFEQYIIVHKCDYLFWWMIIYFDGWLFMLILFVIIIVIIMIIMIIVIIVSSTVKIVEHECQHTKNEEVI